MPNEQPASIERTPSINPLLRLRTVDKVPKLISLTHNYLHLFEFLSLGYKRRPQHLV